MNRFAELLDRLAYEPGRNNKIRLLVGYFRETEDPDRGYALAVDSYIPGMAAMAVPLCPPDGGAALGCLSIAGPAVRLTPARMRDLAPLLQAAASELAEAAAGSQYFRSSRKSGKSY